MKDLAREAELERLISEKTKACGEKNWMRMKRTFFIFSGVIYLVVLYVGLDFKIIDIKYLLSWLVFSPVLAGFIMFISYFGILHYIITKALEDAIDVLDVLVITSLPILHSFIKDKF